MNKRRSKATHSGRSAPSEPTSSVSRGRHEYWCKVCSHPQREEIEHGFINWMSPAVLAKQYGLSRDSVYRHAHALGLFPKRQRNVRAALERIIEKAGEVQVNASAVVSAVATYSRINATGQWVERSEQINLSDLFERMSREELDRYAKTGELPDWFTGTVGATPSDSPDREKSA